MDEINNKLYIIPRFDKNGEVVKTHLARVTPFQFGRILPYIEMLCLPNIPIMLHNCECPAKCNGDCDGIEADIKWAEYWDVSFNEVTCPTCLRIARWGYKNKIPNDAQEVLV